MPIRIQKGNYTRSKNELLKLKPLIENLKNVPITDYQLEAIASNKVSLQHYKDRLRVFDERRQALENAVPSGDNQYDTLFPTEDDEMYNDLCLYIVEIESRMCEYECKIEKEEQEAKEKKEKEEQEAKEKKEKEEQEAKEKKEEEEAKQKREDLEYNRERERLREERENEKEIREITERSEREQREHRVKIQEIELRKLEIERSKNNVGGSSSSNSSSEHVNSSNLPKIELCKFDGTVEKYQEFWDNFQTLVDSRTDLADNVKLHYLKGQLIGKAASLVQGLRITTENYKVAKDVLKDEFGLPQVVQNKIYYEIHRMKSYSDKQCHIEEFYRKLEISLKLLENQGVDVNSSVFLASNLFMKLPECTQKILVKDKGSDITVKDIREQMSVELRCDRLLRSLNPELDRKKYENNSDPVRSMPKPPVRPSYTTQALVSIDGTRHTVCVYCDGAHYADECDRYRTVDTRKEKLGNRCFVCLLPGHRSGYCRLEYRCWHCSKFNAHHRSLCPRKYSNEGKNDNQHRAHALSSDSRNYGSKPGPSNSKSGPNLSTTYKSETKPGSTSVDNNENTMVSTVSCAVNSVVFMQTAVVNVYEEKTDRFISVRAILDTASSHSYMSERLLKVLDSKVRQSMNMNVYTFGALEPKKMNAPEVCIKIATTDKPYDLNVFVVPNIVCGGNVRNYNTDFLRNVDKSYPLADRFLLDKPTQEYDLLIGMDYYSHFIVGEKIQIDRNLFLWQTAFGYVLSGTKSNVVHHGNTTFGSVLLARMELCDDHSEGDVPNNRYHQNLDTKENCSISESDLALQSFHSTQKFECKRFVVNTQVENDTKVVQSKVDHEFGQLKTPVKRSEKVGGLKVYEKTLVDQSEKKICKYLDNKYCNLSFLINLLLCMLFVMLSLNLFIEIKTDPLRCEQVNYNSQKKCVTFNNLMNPCEKSNPLIDLIWRTWVKLKQFLDVLHERKGTALKQGKILSLKPRVKEVELTKDLEINLGT